MVKAIVDTDPDLDDAFALLMAIRSPELEALGITAVGGNAPLARTTRNALGILEHVASSDIPVLGGRTAPPRALPLRSSPPRAGRPHGPPASPAIGARSAVCRRVHRRPGKMPGALTLIALGPLTNISRAIELEPLLKSWIRQIIVMGGAVGVPGNVTHHAEFNVYNNPAAARVVISSGIPTTLVGLDVCNQVGVPRADQWPTGGSPAAELGRGLLSGWFAERSSDARFSLCDPLAVAALLRPAIFSFRGASVAVETEDLERLGQTTARYGDGAVKVAISVKAEQAKGFIDSLL